MNSGVAGIGNLAGPVLSPGTSRVDVCSWACRVSAGQSQELSAPRFHQPPPYRFLPYVTVHMPRFGGGGEGHAAAALTYLHWCLAGLQRSFFATLDFLNVLWARGDTGTSHLALRGICSSAATSVNLFRGILLKKQF